MIRTVFGRNKKKKPILDLPLQNSTIDITNNYIIVAGGTSNLPTFALSGRKTGEYCAVFNGSQSLKTASNLIMNSDKVTIAFWIKTTQTSAATIAELSPNFNSISNAFGSFINNLLANRIDISDRQGNYNLGYSSVINNLGNWIHVIATIDRSLGIDQNKIYINGILAYTQLTGIYYSDLSGNFTTAHPLFVGQRGGNSLGFVGSMTLFKIYKDKFSASEALNLYNSEL